MNNVFHKKFGEEVLVNERLRTMILACVFFIGTLGAGVLLLFFSNDGYDELLTSSLLRIFFFQLSLFMFEIMALLYIIRRINKNVQNIPIAGQYVNVAIEMMAPAIILFLLSQHYHTPARVLHSPIVNIYFVLIILSTLRLNFRISFFAGVLAASGYLFLSLHLISITKGGNEGSDFRNEYVIAIAKSVGLLVSGTGAAFVARQIRLGINRSVKVAEEANKVVNLFGQQISKEIVDEMLQNDGSVKSKMMKVCIMFIDIRNFTKFVMDKSPVEIVKYQNAFFSMVVNCVTRHHGIVNQFLGDGCMVTFGAPTPLRNPSQHAVDAAMEIQKELNKEIGKGNIPLTRIGIGIHTGDAVTGNIGNSERQQYSITGNVVILASRIEQLNKEFNSQFLVSADVIKSIDSSINSELMGAVNIKGWSEPVPVYKLA
ncbi:MAG TPA: adenylate/guanylate cyclase domain-containing protein [Chitinophagaceae bacterium]|nr:adenylate/guanylate cyclase domain-containing protein [Chitinophagaceae bacterium]